MTRTNEFSFLLETENGYLLCDVDYEYQSRFMADCPVDNVNYVIHGTTSIPKQDLAYVVKMEIEKILGDIELLNKIEGIMIPSPVPVEL